MSARPKWQLAKERYIGNLLDQFDHSRFGYGFNIVKRVYANAFRFEQALNDRNGIDPDEVDVCIQELERAVKELREWQTLKQIDWNKTNATVAGRP